VVHGSWADWGSHDEWGPTIGLVDVNHSDPQIRRELNE
jgi:hypothetical protein